MKIKRLMLVLLLLPAFFSTEIFSQTTLRVVSWNVESGGNDADYIANRLKDFKSYHLIGLNEVNSSNRSKYDQALGSNFASVIGTTGSGKRLYIAYDKNRFRMVGNLVELDDINIDGTVRAPLYVELEEIQTNKNLIFMVNHLARSDKRNGTTNRRLKQSELLNEWVEKQTVPVIAVGDYNYDFQIVNDQHNDGLDAILADQNFFWIYPTNFQRTQCNMSYEAAILDFIFVNRKALILSPSSQIQEHPRNCKDTNENSDHLAILAEFQF